METGKQMTSMTVWERIPATEQVEIITRAVKRAVYIAGAYSVVLTVDEIMGQTWENTVKRLDADRLSKANAKRMAEGKAVGINNVAVHKRLAKMRKDLREAIA